MNSRYLAALLLCITPISVVSAQQSFNSCDFCLASQGIAPAEAGATGLRIDVRYLRLASTFREGEKVNNTDRELETHFTQQFTLSIGLSQDVSLLAVVPVARRYSERLAEDGSMVVGDQFGVADVSVLGRWKVIEEHSMDATTILSFVGGAKLPTGKTGGVDSRRELVDAHVQLGTGSTDILAGVNGIFSFDRTAVIVNLLGALTGKGAHGHQFGNNLNYEAAVRYKVIPSGYGDMQVFAVLGVDGEWRGEETQDGLADENSGGNVTFIAPGVQWFLNPALSLEARVEYPLFHQLHGLQLGEDFRLRGGVQILL